MLRVDWGKRDHLVDSKFSKIWEISANLACSQLAHLGWPDQFDGSQKSILSVFPRKMHSNHGTVAGNSLQTFVMIINNVLQLSKLFNDQILNSNFNGQNYITVEFSNSFSHVFDINNGFTCVHRLQICFKYV